MQILSNGTRAPSIMKSEIHPFSVYVTAEGYDSSCLSLLNCITGEAILYEDIKTNSFYPAMSQIIQKENESSTSNIQLSEFYCRCRESNTSLECCDISSSKYSTKKMENLATLPNSVAISPAYFSYLYPRIRAFLIIENGMYEFIGDHKNVFEGYKVSRDNRSLIFQKQYPQSERGHVFNKCLTKIEVVEKMRNGVKLLLTFADRIEVVTVHGISVKGYGRESDLEDVKERIGYLMELISENEDNNLSVLEIKSPNFCSKILKCIM